MSPHLVWHNLFQNTYNTFDENQFGIASFANWTLRLPCKMKYWQNSITIFAFDTACTQHNWHQLALLGLFSISFGLMNEPWITLGGAQRWCVPHQLTDNPQKHQGWHFKQHSSKLSSVPLLLPAVADHLRCFFCITVCPWWEINSLLWHIPFWLIHKMCFALSLMRNHQRQRGRLWIPYQLFPVAHLVTSSGKLKFELYQTLAMLHTIQA